MPRYQFTDADRAKAAARRKRDSELLKDLRAGAKQARRAFKELDDEAVLGVLGTIAMDETLDQLVRTRAAQAYLRERREAGEDTAATLQAKRNRVEELLRGQEDDQPDGGEAS